MDQQPQLNDYPSKTRFGLLQTTIEADFERKTKLLRITLEGIVAKLPAETLSGVQRAFDVIFGNVDSKLQEFRSRTVECERLWATLHSARQSAKAILGSAVAEPPVRGAFASKKIRRWGQAVHEHQVAVLQNMQQIMDAVDAYAAAQSDILRLRFEIAELVNAAAAFVAEQAAAARRLGEPGFNLSVVRRAQAERAAEAIVTDDAQPFAVSGH